MVFYIERTYRSPRLKRQRGQGETLIFDTPSGETVTLTDFSDKGYEAAIEEISKLEGMGVALSDTQKRQIVDAYTTGLPKEEEKKPAENTPPSTGWGKPRQAPQPPPTPEPVSAEIPVPGDAAVLSWDAPKQEPVKYDDNPFAAKQEEPTAASEEAPAEKTPPVYDDNPFAEKAENTPSEKPPAPQRDGNWFTGEPAAPPARKEQGVEEELFPGDGIPNAVDAAVTAEGEGEALSEEKKKKKKKRTKEEKKSERELARIKEEKARQEKNPKSPKPKAKKKVQPHELKELNRQKIGEIINTDMFYDPQTVKDEGFDRSKIEGSKSILYMFFAIVAAAVIGVVIYLQIALG